MREYGDLIIRQSGDSMVCQLADSTITARTINTHCRIAKSLNCRISYYRQGVKTYIAELSHHRIAKLKKLPERSFFTLWNGKSGMEIRHA